MPRNVDKSFNHSSVKQIGFDDVERMRQTLAAKSFSKMLAPIQAELDKGDADRFALQELLATLAMPRNREHMGEFPGHDELYAIVDRMLADFKERHPPDGGPEVVSSASPAEGKA